MKAISSVVWGALFMLFAATTVSALDAKQPDVISRGTDTVATVNDDVITMDELTKALTSSHEGRNEGDAQAAGKIDYMKILDRLINIRLAAQEAANIGLDELPEFNAAVEEKASTTLASLVMKDIGKDVKPDPLVVEKRYKEMVVEWKIKTVLFKKEDDAKAMTDGIKAGKSFDELAQAARDAKKAVGAEQGAFVKAKDMDPSIAALVSTLEVGGVSPVIKLAGEKKGFTVLQLEDRRYPEDTAALQRAAQVARADKVNEALDEYKQMLYKTQVTIKEKLLNKVDYDSPKANIQKLRSDDRVLVKFKDGKTITVGALTQGLQDKFFHGVEQAGKDKLVNKAKREVLDKLIEDKLIRDEGLRRGIEKSAEYQEKIREFRLSTLFGLFIKRVVIPDVKVTDDELRSYYQAHKDEYTDPEMLKMVSLDFANKRAAEAALKKLKKGADINWVRANAEGLVASADKEDGGTSGMLILTRKDLPAEMAKALAGATPGDFRLSGSSILSIQEVIPSRQQPYEEVKELIRKPVSNAAVTRAIEDWFRKLRAAADVQVYLSGVGN